MRAKLDNLNHCAVAFLSRAVANVCWYYSIVCVVVLSKKNTQDTQLYYTKVPLNIIVTAKATAGKYSPRTL